MDGLVKADNLVGHLIRQFPGRFRTITVVVDTQPARWQSVFREADHCVNSLSFAMSAKVIDLGGIFQHIFKNRQLTELQPVASANLMTPEDPGLEFEDRRPDIVPVELAAEVRERKFSVQTGKARPVRVPRVSRCRCKPPEVQVVGSDPFAGRTEEGVAGDWAQGPHQL